MSGLGRAVWPNGMLVCLANFGSSRWSPPANDVSLEQAVAVAAGALGLLVATRMALRATAHTSLGSRQQLAALGMTSLIAAIPALAAPSIADSPGSLLPPENLADSAARRGDEHLGRTHTVESGENLWSISEESLTRAIGRTPEPLEEVDPFWRSVVDLNLSNLESGDADLIYPGEQIMLPSAAGR